MNTPVLKLVKNVPLEKSVHAGDVLEGRYRLQRVIGDGGMGTVFLAEHVLIKRRVAIKVLHRELAHDSEVVERFMNEARAAGTLGHPNIVESTDMGFARDEVPYIVFEYLEGTALSDEIYRLRGLTVRRAVKIAHQIASALEAAHRASIIHRDLKSDNIFLTDKDDSLDHVKVLDFGISRFLEAEQDRTGRGTKRGAVMMGTPEFMAPEQILSPDRVDARTDIYALGVVIYEMLAGRTPFLDENKSDPHELLHRIVLDRPPALARNDLPAGFANMMFEKLLAKEPDARYQTMGDVQAALEAFISVMRRDTQPSIPPAAQPVSLPAQPAPSRHWRWVIAGLLVAAGAGASAMLWSQQQAATEAPAPTALADPVDATATLERDAKLLANALDAAASAVQLRADGLATSPMLRAAIETDTATLTDMVRDGAIFTPQPGEVLEIFQERVSLLRVPTSAKALPVIPNKGVRLVARGTSLLLVAGTPVLKTTGSLGGSLSLAIAIDLRTLAPQLAERASELRIEPGGLVLGAIPVPTTLVQPHKE